MPGFDVLEAKKRERRHQALKKKLDERTGETGADEGRHYQPDMLGPPCRYCATAVPLALKTDEHPACGPEADALRALAASTTPPPEAPYVEEEAP